MFSSRTIAILQALLVTFIWSASWVLIKIGLDDIPALTFAGMRYSLAFLCLLLLAGRSPTIRTSLRQLTRRQWIILLLLGIVLYAIAQGAQFLALVYLPAITLSLLLNFTAIAVAIGGMIFLAEIPTSRQWLGIVMFLTGVMIYFWPVEFPGQQVLGLLIAVVNVLGNATGGVLGRYVNRDGSINARTVTLVSMGIGSMLLLVTGLIVEPMPVLNARSWLIIIWLAVVHTAFTFTLWNITLRTLTAVESSIINNTMLIQIAILAWIFLGETITLKDGIGLAVAAFGILMVQLGSRAVRQHRLKKV